VRVIGLQTEIEWENKPANFSRARRLVETAAPPAGALVALPEMFATGFSMNASAIAEDYGGPLERFLSELSRAHAIWLVAGAAMRGRDGRIRNKALVFSPEGRLAGFYAKMRPFTPGGEPDHYQAGERPAVIPCGPCVVAPFVCYDLRFPELFRMAAANGRPELYVVIANWPEKRIQHWVRLLQARAIENQAFVLGVNRTGSDPHYVYSGRSLLVDFNGDILADAGAAEGILSGDLDLATLRQYRQGLPFLTDLKL
jgi:predicted amidohydrolase